MSAAQPVRLEVKDLSFRYAGRELLLGGVSFTVCGGETLCLLGPNGSGKTTLLRCLLNITRMESGSIQIDGRETDGMPRRALAQHIAWVPQSATVMFPFTVFEIVLMGRTSHASAFSSPSRGDRRRAMDALNQLGIGRLRDRPLNQISGGERQLTLIARALCQDARILIMDEPAASLDYGNQIRVLQIVNSLRQSGYAIVMSAHNPDHAFLSATHAAVLSGGRIVAIGDPHSVVTSERLSELYSARIRVVTAPLPGDPGVEVKVCVPVI
jgi:iron complex transport system ATP-binding protein